MRGGVLHACERCRLLKLRESSASLDFRDEATDRSVSKRSYTVVPSAPNSLPEGETQALWLELAPLPRIPPYGMRYASLL